MVDEDMARTYRKKFLREPRRLKRPSTRDFNVQAPNSIYPKSIEKMHKNHSGRIGRQSILLAAIVLSPVFSRADVYTVSRNGSTIKPLVSADISMDAETVLIEPKAQFEGFYCTATFVMRNQSGKPVSCTVAFPVDGSHSTFSGERLDREFKVEAKSGTAPETPFGAISAAVRVNAGMASGDSQIRFDRKYADGTTRGENIVWDMTWAPNETKSIRVSYEMGEPAYLSGLREITEVTQLLYIVRTGALWKGPIGSADVSIRFVTPPPKPGEEVKPEIGLQSYPSPNLISWPQNARWIGPEGKPTEVRWHFENWTPTEDIWVKWTYWRGFDPKAHDWFLLPTPYQGAKIAYSAELLDGLVERELALARQYFPEKVATFDRGPLRKSIAEWLYREIYARHGESFYIGTFNGDPKTLKEGTVGSGGYLYSDWCLRFAGYGRRDGWYQPKPDPNGTVRFEELSQMEQKNALFLRRNFDANDAK